MMLPAAILFALCLICPPTLANGGVERSGTFDKAAAELSAPANRATLGNVRGGTVSEANGGVERSETFVGADGSAAAPASEDSTKFAKFDSLLVQFHAALLQEDFDTKAEQMDFLVEACHDSLLRQHVALKIYDYYKDSPVMGDESVAIHIYDRWFADGTIAMRSEYDRIDAQMFSDFNRRTLLGERAPEVELYNYRGKAVRIPSKGSFSLIFFYDTSCAKCRMVVKLLPDVLKRVDFPLDLIMVYCGQEKKSWKSLIDSFRSGNGNVKTVHLWDPEFKSDYIKNYGVIGTPKIFMIEPDGLVLGRRLELDNLLELLDVASSISKITN